MPEKLTKPSRGRLQMKIVFPCALIAAVSLTAIPALAQIPVDCSATPDRASGLRYMETRKSLADLSVTIDKAQEKKLTLRSLKLVEGSCADKVHAFLMNMIAFNDGTVMVIDAKGRFSSKQGYTKTTDFWNSSPPAGHPAIAQAEFVMASKIDGAAPKPTLNIGLWKTSEGSLLAAFVQREDGFSAPIELVQSKQQIKSVTFFPSPDTSTGSLGLLAITENGVALLSLDWDHSALSKSLASESTAN